MKTLSVIFRVAAGLLSHTMVAVVAYSYCAWQLGDRYAPNSAPPSVAFLWAIPFAVGIAVCVGLALYFRKRAG